MEWSREKDRVCFTPPWLSKSAVAPHDGLERAEVQVPCYAFAAIAMDEATDSPVVFGYSRVVIV
jgi:hypothetical protein